LKILSKNSFTLDGHWFLAIEDRYGLNIAVEIDREVWRKYAVSEARRVKKFLGIKEGNLTDLKKALQLISIAQAPSFEMENKDKLLVTVKDCKPQSARINSGRNEFPCKQVDLAHLSVFTMEINNKIKIKCIQCPPDGVDKDVWCSWEFTLS
jgi:hypothetical protein